MGAKDDILTQFDERGIALGLTQVSADATAVPESTDLLVSCPPADYSAASMARAAEDCDAHITYLNLLPQRDENGALLTALRVNRVDGLAVARSLERYGYKVVSVRGPLAARDVESLSRRAREVMHYLEL